MPLHSGRPSNREAKKKLSVCRFHGTLLLHLVAHKKLPDNASDGIKVVVPCAGAVGLNEGDLVGFGVGLGFASSGRLRLLTGLQRGLEWPAQQKHHRRC
jgi:hypothetical protein